MQNLLDTLLKAHSEIQTLRSSSVDCLISQCEANPSFVFETLSQALISSYPSDVLIKSAIFIKSRISFYWRNVSEESQEKIKQYCLMALANSDTSILNSVSSAISAIAAIEIPKGKWLNLLDILLSNSHNINLQYKQASLVSLKYICEDIENSDFPAQYKPDLLTSIINNMNSRVPMLISLSLDIFIHSASIFEENFNVKEENEYILNSIYSTFQSDPYKCLQALCGIMANFPESFKQSIMELSNITFTAINSCDEKTVTVAIEIWNTAADVDENRLKSGCPLLNYLKFACKSLVNLLLPRLSKNFKLKDSEWNSSKASYNLLSMIIYICSEDIGKQVYDFVNACFSSNSSVQVQTGLLAISAAFQLYSCGSNDKFLDYFPVLIGFMKGQNQLYANNSILAVMNMIENSRDRIEKCDVLEIMTICKDTLTRMDGSLIYASDCLSKILIRYRTSFDMYEYQETLRFLLVFLEDSKVKTDNKVLVLSLIVTIFENMPEIYIQLYLNYFKNFISFLLKAFAAKSKIMISKILNILFLCCMKCPAYKVDQSDVDKLFKLAFKAIDEFDLIEDSYSLIGSLCQNSKTNFYKEYQYILPMLLKSLSEIESPDKISYSIILASDIAGGMGTLFIESFSEFIPLLTKVLECENLNISHKNLAISCLGDIISNVKGAILPYLDKIFVYIDAAAGISLDLEYERLIGDSLLELRSIILDFYINTIKGLAGCSIEAITRKIPQLCQYILLVTDKVYTPTIDMIQHSVWLISDINRLFSKAVDIRMFVSYLNEVIETRGLVEARAALGEINCMSAQYK